MAVDTREKRASAGALLLWSTAPGIEPSSVDQAERQAAAQIYAGILAGAAAEAAGGAILHFIAWPFYR